MDPDLIEYVIHRDLAKEKVKNLQCTIRRAKQELLRIRLNCKHDWNPTNSLVMLKCAICGKLRRNEIY